jgi:very-short-patch-repair endonuclease
MAWAEVASEQAGAITRQQLRASGIAGMTVNRLVSRGALVRHETGVFVVRGAPVTYATQLWIAVLATSGILGFATAAHLWGMEQARPAVIDVVIGSGRRVARPYGVRLFHVFVPSSAITTTDVLPVTSRAWSLLDYVSSLPVPDALRMTDRAIQRRWIARDDLLRRLADYPGRRGNGVIRALAAATSDGAAAKSERLLHRLLTRAGIRGWSANFAVEVDATVVAVIDVAMPERRLAIEVDGFAYHSDVERFEHDRHRQNVLVSLGWTVLRFTWRDLTGRPEYVVSTIRRHLG